MVAESKLEIEINLCFEDRACGDIRLFFPTLRRGREVLGLSLPRRAELNGTPNQVKIFYDDATLMKADLQRIENFKYARLLLEEARIVQNYILLVFYAGVSIDIKPHQTPQFYA